MIKLVKDSSVRLDLDSYDIELDKEYTVKELIDVIINHGVCESGLSKYTMVQHYPLNVFSLKG